MLFFLLNVKNDRLDATLIIIIFFFLAEYTGVILTLTSGNVTFYDRNFDFILKIL